VGTDVLHHPAQRWFAVGRSDAADAQAAGEQAARDALEGRAAKLLVVFCSDEYDLPALLAAINAQSGGAPLIGCSTAGEIATSGPGDAGVVVVALGGDGFSVETDVATDVRDDLRGAGAHVATTLERVESRPHRVLMLLTDGLAGDQQEIVRGAHSVAGAGVPLVGGCAGDGLKMRATWQLYGDRVLQHAVVGAAIASDAPLGIGVRHGWRAVGQPMLVTSSADNRVYSLDDKPALDVYLDLLDAPGSVRTSSGASSRSR